MSNRARRLKIGERMRMKAQSTDQSRRRNEVRIRRTDVVVAAGEKMAEFMGEQDAHERHRKRDARNKQSRLEERPEIIGKEAVDSRRLIGSVGCRELGACG